MMVGAPVDFVKKFISSVRTLKNPDGKLKCLFYFLLELLDVIILAKVNTRFDIMY